MSKKIRVFLIFLLATVALIVNLMSYNLKITNYTFSSKKIQRPMRFVLLTDLHQTRHVQNIISEVKGNKPDAIMIAGDLMNKDNCNIQYARSLLHALGKIAPVYYAPGNHEAHFINEDYNWGSKIVKGIPNVTFVYEKVYQERINGNAVSISGVGCDEYSYRKWHLKVADKLVKENGYTIMLSHFPYNIINFKGKGIDLVLSGHTHGGQVSIHNKGLYVPGYGLFPKYTNGKYVFGDTTMIVSRGLGDHTILPRINNPHEIVILDIVPSERS